MADPISPPIAPMKNPVLRPRTCITWLSQGAVDMEPNTIIEIGSVARQGLGASISPASPPITKIIVTCEPRMACAATSTATLRFAVLSSGGSVMVMTKSLNPPARRCNASQPRLSIRCAKEPQTRPASRPMGGRALPSASVAANKGAPRAWAVVA